MFHQCFIKSCWPTASIWVPDVSILAIWHRSEAWKCRQHHSSTCLCPKSALCSHLPRTRWFRICYTYIYIYIYNHLDIFRYIYDYLCTFYLILLVWSCMSVLLCCSTYSICTRRIMTHPCCFASARIVSISWSIVFAAVWAPLLADIMFQRGTWMNKTHLLHLAGAISTQNIPKPNITT